MPTFEEMFAKGEFYPPVEHQDRIKKYKENRLLVEGKHAQLFNKHNFNRNSKLYVSVNLAGIIAKKSADFLIGDGVQVSAGKEDNSKEQLAFDRIKDVNDLDILFYESALANAYRGDSFFKVRYGQEFGGMYPPEFDEPRVIIETVNAEYVFPETAAHNRNLIKAYHIAIPIRLEQDEEVTEADWVLNVESHYAGKIVYNQFKLRVMVTEADGTPIEWKIGEPTMNPVEVLTGVPVPLVVHVPNYSLDDGWEGLDDLSELKPLFDELNNRLSQVASILDKHSDPAIAIPMGLMTEDEHGRPIFNVANSKVFEIDGNSKDIIPQYVTWNGQLQEAYAEIDRLIEMILVTAEIPAVALGKGGDAGTSGASGLAIRFRLNSLLAKIKRKRKYYEKGLKKVFLIAQHLETVVGVADYEITTPKLTFTDGLDKDELQEANLIAIRTGGAITMSQKTAIMKLDGLTEEQADAEIKRIEEEQSALAEKQAVASPSIFNDLMDEGQPVEDNTNTEGEQE
ncbi:phage portal protein [Neobacillus vireti]|uniref:phage portal protein n=1 Tax=Neobacillus vireti TaxID=220686 RepID=UPI002FFE7B9A